MGFLPSSAAPSIIYLKPPYAIGSVPSLSGHAIAYRWVRRHRASKPQGSSERVLPWQVTMDQQSIRASLSHTHCRYEVGMWKVPAMLFRDSRFSYRLNLLRSKTGGSSLSIRPPLYRTVVTYSGITVYRSQILYVLPPFLAMPSGS